MKQVDEFIERFNNDPSSFINEYAQKSGQAGPLTREKMIKSLFNAKASGWNYQQINDFIKQVSSPDAPQYLDFNGDGWFARVKCRVLCNGRPEDATLILQTDTLANGASKWVIADINFSERVRLALKKDSAEELLPCPAPADSTTSYNPMSHATGFLNIDLATRNPENISNFVIGPGDRSRNLNLFIDACLRKRFKIVRANSVTYSFLQIKGWRIEISQFTRQSMNSGWLISKLALVKKRS
ncbi:hypothetical protein [Hymenobacter sp. UYCo722]|uniref:hypothetical protein n=1 Tax=Hymenobacter sp. UYCo722 TaxID=3156335 RepID=UPI003390994B